MSPQMRRYLPFILIALLIFVIVPLLRGRSSSSSISDGDRSTLTLKALNAIDGGEVAYFKANKHYTSQLADLIWAAKPVAALLPPGTARALHAVPDWLTLGMAVQLDASSDGASYVVQLESSVLNVLRARTGDAPLPKTDSCNVVKSSSGVACPAGTTRAAKPVTATTATGTVPSPTAPLSTTSTTGK